MFFIPNRNVYRQFYATKGYRHEKDYIVQDLKQLSINMLVTTCYETSDDWHRARIVDIINPMEIHVKLFFNVFFKLIIKRSVA